MLCTCSATLFFAACTEGPNTDNPKQPVVIDSKPSPDASLPMRNAAELLQIQPVVVGKLAAPQLLPKEGADLAVVLELNRGLAMHTLGIKEHVDANALPQKIQAALKENIANKSNNVPSYDVTYQKGNLLSISLSVVRVRPSRVERKDIVFDVSTGKEVSLEDAFGAAAAS